jgi:peptidyl-prolyl cis-trans isomerase C
MVRRGLVIKNLVNTEVASKVTVSDAEISKFYEENKDKLFKTDESVRVSHILIGVDAKADVAQKRKAREKAEGILKRIRGGEDFAALAKKESTCPSAPLGGDLGFFTKGQMVQEFEKAAFELKPGEVSNVVETKYGFHIIKLQDRKSAGITPLNEEKKKIETYLKAQKVRNGVEGYLMNLQKTAKVETLIN